ncbi:protease inhibitor I42 family protein [bacterium]|nr:protease inhibitor I42 family protein [bacterium]
MEKNILLLLIAIIAVTLNGMSNSPKMSCFEKDDNGRQIQLTANQKFTVTLPANPSTGYHWVIADTDSACFRECGADTFLLSSDPKKEGAILVGAGGNQQFFFQAADHGNGELLLQYQRPWEKKKAPADSFRLSIKIRN